MSDTDVIDDQKIGCALCGARVHIMAKHLREEHDGMTEAEYLAAHPGSPMLSPMALARLKERQEERAKTEAASPAPLTVGLLSQTDIEVEKAAMHEVFKLGKVKAAMNSRTGDPLPISVCKVPPHLSLFVPDRDPNYVFPIPLLKTALMALEVNIPAYFWGMMGTGKSTIWEQTAAHTGRPWLRIQHTRNTEESHIVGSWMVRDGQTVFELGPLAYAMKHGLLYCADEYDFAMPAVISVYQAVLERKPLIIKEADEANRIIRPHRNFRFVATGNTNGTGDETGLYQGTMLQNAASYERFGIVEEVKYVDKKTEITLVMNQGGVPKEIAEKLVDIGNRCREAFAAQKLGLPPSPRSLINAAINGRMLGDIAAGFKLAYVNRLPRVDQEAVTEIMGRVAL